MLIPAKRVADEGLCVNNEEIYVRTLQFCLGFGDEWVDVARRLGKCLHFPGALFEDDDTADVPKDVVRLVILALSKRDDY